MYVLTFVLFGLCTLKVVSSLQCHQCITADYATLDEVDRLSMVGEELRKCTESVTCGTGEVCATIPVLLQGTYSNTTDSNWRNYRYGRWELGSRGRTCVKKGNSVTRYSVLHIGKKQGFTSILETYLKSVYGKLTAMGLSSDYEDPIITIGNVEKCSTNLCNAVVTSTPPTPLQCYSCTTVTSLTTDGFSGEEESSIERFRKVISGNCRNTTTCAPGGVCGKIPLSLTGSFEDSIRIDSDSYREVSGSFELNVIAKKCVWEGQGSYDILLDDESDATEIFYGAVNIDKGAVYDKIDQAAGGDDRLWWLGGFDLTCSIGSLETCNIAKCNGGTGTGKGTANSAGGCM